MSSERPFDADDPRLTAYVLGELDAPERAAVEQQLARCEATRGAVAEIRETMRLVTESLHGEPAAELSASQRARIETLAAGKAAVRPTIQSGVPRRKLLATLTCVGVTAAAVLVLVLPPLLREPEGETGRRSAGVAAGDAFGDRAEEVAMTAAPDDARADDDLLGRRLNRFGEQGQFEAGKSGQAGGFIAPQEPSAVFDADGREHGAFPAQTFSRTESQPRSSDELPMPEASLAGRSRPIANSTIRESDVLSAGARPGSSASELRRGAAVDPSGQPPARRRPAMAATPPPPTAGGEGLQQRLAVPGEEQAEALIPGAFGNEAYSAIVENEFIAPVGQAALSTFSIDVDTASYANVRRFLKHGQFPPPDAVRIEELVNYFRYDYPEPDGERPFSVTTEIGVCPWNTDHRLARIGLKGRSIPKEDRPVSNLVFLIDVSGSMRDANKLPLVKQGLELLVQEMTEDDRVAIVTYAGEAGVKLPSTSGDRRSEILSAIHGLSAGGSTNGEAGIHLAYTEAIQNFVEEGTNRVILCTDGDFNVGVSDDNELVKLIQDKARQSKVFLSILGFGMGNLKDAKLEQLANKGNGHYAYVDGIREAKKVFSEELTGTLYTIAKDVKIQIEFNPARVGRYRLIGYENRVLAARDFHDDTKDAGEIGAGHTVTALYELVPPEKVAEEVGREPLKYQKEQAAPAKENASEESFTVKLRYKLPDEDQSTLFDFPVVDAASRGESPSVDFDWAAAVAAFGMVLRNSKHKGQADLDLVRELATGARGPDAAGLRREFLDLVYTAKSLREQQAGRPVPVPEQLAPEAAQKKATVEGKYSKLLKTLSIPGDYQQYGGFHDYGRWEGTSYAGHDELPVGYWVYVYPTWYIFEQKD
ncbi:MAG: von Willebrand factor type A domain-containing protein [Planctomycetes bacterium]|nr:von Willebrand factor type A domain-containing protein [Planctomycetota bacterium]